MAGIVKVCTIVFCIGALVYAGDAKVEGAQKKLGDKQDFGILATITESYVVVRNLVKDAYVEIQTWKALKANMERQKRWFENNLERWQGIGNKAMKVMSNPTDVLDNLRTLEDMSDDVDAFFMYETDKFGDIMTNYETGLNTMWDVGAPYFIKDASTSEQLWDRAYAFSVQNSLKGNSNLLPDLTDEELSNLGLLSSITPDEANPFNLSELRLSRGAMGQSWSLVKGQNEDLKAKRNKRLQWYKDFYEQTAKLATSPETKVDAIRGMDVALRVNALNEQSDLLVLKALELQNVLGLHGQSVYAITGKTKLHYQQVMALDEIKKMVAK